MAESGWRRVTCKSSKVRGPGSVVLLEFPCIDDAWNWYYSPEYQKIVRLRINNVISDLILVDGVRPDFTVAGFARRIRAAVKAAASPA
jgi:hypothetical protein